MKSHTPTLLYFGCAEIGVCCLLCYRQLIFAISWVAEWLAT